MKTNLQPQQRARHMKPANLEVDGNQYPVLIWKRKSGEMLFKHDKEGLFQSEPVDIHLPIPQEVQ